MFIRHQFWDEVRANFDYPRNMLPGIEVWPGEGDFADWITYHLTSDRSVLCTLPEFKSSPFCGIGYHG
ncbi:MAG TPA: hypothetical protein VK463_14110 [Desulfomonilaceae bacterium]|nr:hypothetical protein [Desulfomonilaceae bacterium]